MLKKNSLEEFLKSIKDLDEFYVSDPVRINFPCSIDNKYPCFVDNNKYPCFVEDNSKYPCEVSDAPKIKNNGPHPQKNWVDIFDDLKKFDEFDFKEVNDRMEQFLKSGEDLVIDPKVHYNIQDTIDSDGDILYREITVPVPGLSPEEVDVTINNVSRYINVSKESFVISVNGRSKKEMTPDYDKYLDTIKQNKKIKVKTVKKSFSISNEFILNILINNDMDPNSVKCFYNNSILKIIIKPKPKQKQVPAKRVKIDVIN